MDNKLKKKSLAIILGLMALCLAGIIFINGHQKHETIKEAMKDAVLHEHNKISLFGILEVNPALASGFIVTAVLLVAALLIRIFVIPKFKTVPGKFQTCLELAVGYFSDLAKSNSPHQNKFLGAYLFAAGVYIFVGTCAELFGIQLITTKGHSMAMPAPLADINGAISLGVLSYLAILSGGIAANGIKGVGKTLKEFSLPISMSFRLFGALLSGLLVTELVYYYFALSFVLPVFVGIMFTLLHALIQAFVLTMLTSIFYGEVSEKEEHEEKANA
ncbi:MAG: F0F1 ATP synthase subunit A [Holdemanella sp.]|nr:F0F1 ATP synthase subunit A [Holdemanella sp.]